MPPISYVGIFIAVATFLSAIPSWWLSYKLLGEKIEQEKLKQSVTNLEIKCKHLDDKIHELENKVDEFAVIKERLNNHISQCEKKHETK